MPNISWEQWGIAGDVIGVLFFILWRMLVWVMSFVKDIVKQHSEERSQWLCALGKHGDLLNKISDNINRHDERADERGRYVREEHKQMIEVLGRIYGYKD